MSATACIECEEKQNEIDRLTRRCAKLEQAIRWIVDAYYLAKGSVVIDKIKLAKLLLEDK